MQRHNGSLKGTLNSNNVLPPFLYQGLTRSTHDMFGRALCLSMHVSLIPLPFSESILKHHQQTFRRRSMPHNSTPTVPNLRLRSPGITRRLSTIRCLCLFSTKCSKNGNRTVLPPPLHSQTASLGRSNPMPSSPSSLPPPPLLLASAMYGMK